ncbi:MAG: hypothetical protein Q8P31_11530 [Bacillota bacterium]|nr:hypothetical protein [Bacillota bacterium]
MRADLHQERADDVLHVVHQLGIVGFHQGLRAERHVGGHLEQLDERVDEKPPIQGLL